MAKTERRKFLQGAALAAGAAFLPKPAAAPMASWSGLDAHLDAIRMAYLAEIHLLADQLRPRFESGELRGFTDDDCERNSDVRYAYCQARGGCDRLTEAQRAELEALVDALPPLPLERIEEAAEKHFGLHGKGEDFDKAYCTACMIQAVAPGSDETDADDSVVGQAVVAVSNDILAVARARGWWRPTNDESPSDNNLPYLAALGGAPEVRS